jgi:hypothetical protein
MKNIVIRCLCIMALSVSLLGFIPGVPVSAASEPDFEIVFSPESLRLEKGESFSIDILVNNNVNTRIIAAQTYINFNPDVLRCDSITQKGKFLTDWVTTHGGSIDDNIIMYPSGSINNSTGKIGLGVSIIGMDCGEWDYGDLANPDDDKLLGDGPTEGGIFCTLNFTALSTDGISTMTFDESTTNLINYRGIPIISGFELGSGKIVVGQPDGADLTVENAHGEWIVQEDGTYNVVFTLHNIGTQPAGASTAQVNVTNTEYEMDEDSDGDGDTDNATLIITTEEVECEALNAGETQTLTVGPFTMYGDKDDVEIIVDVNEYVREVDEYNNTLEFIWPRYTLSDLTVESISSTWSVQNQSYMLTFTVKNIYYGNSESCTAVITADGNQIATVNIPKLKPQQVYTSSQLGPYNFWGYNDIIEATVDPENDVEETDETNNTSRYAVTRIFSSPTHDSVLFLDKTTTGTAVVWKDFPTAIEFWVTVTTGDPETKIYEDRVKYTELYIPADTLCYDTGYTVRVWAEVPYLTGYIYRLLYTQSFTTLPIPPSYSAHLSPVNGANDIPIVVSFAWDTVSGAISYDFELNTNADFHKAFVVIKESLNNPYEGSDTPLNYSTTYYWRVRAVGDGGPGDWVNSSFTTIEAPVTRTPSVLEPPVFTFAETNDVQQNQDEAVITVILEEEAEELPDYVFVRASQDVSNWLYLVGGIVLLSLLTCGLSMIAIIRRK